MRSWPSSVASFCPWSCGHGAQIEAAHGQNKLDRKATMSPGDPACSSSSWQTCQVCQTMV
jgi:hypothetical protein